MRVPCQRNRRLLGATALHVGIALSISCRGGSDPGTKQRFNEVSTPSPYGAVLPTDEGRKLLDQCSRPTPSLVTSFWTPPASVIAEMEKRLPSVVSNLSVQRAPLDSVYIRQYIGLVRADGKRTIYVNAIDKAYIASLNRMRSQLAKGPPASVPDTTSWRIVPIVVCDGGVRFWGVEYDQHTKTFKQIRMNQNAG